MLYNVCVICYIDQDKVGTIKLLSEMRDDMFEILSQIFDLVKFIMVFISVVYISRVARTRKLRKFSIKFRDLVITKEFFDK